MHDPRLDRTPKPWAPDSWPTAEQLADWLEVCTREERIEFTTAELRNAQREHGHNVRCPHMLSCPYT
jgi:hypothetical protein